MAFVFRLFVCLSARACVSRSGSFVECKGVVGLILIFNGLCYVYSLFVLSLLLLFCEVSKLYYSR